MLCWEDRKYISDIHLGIFTKRILIFNFTGKDTFYPIWSIITPSGKEIFYEHLFQNQPSISEHLFQSFRTSPQSMSNILSDMSATSVKTGSTGFVCFWLWHWFIHRKAYMFGNPMGIQLQSKPACSPSWQLGILIFRFFKCSQTCLFPILAAFLISSSSFFSSLSSSLLHSHCCLTERQWLVDSFWSLILQFWVLAIFDLGIF